MVKITNVMEKQNEFDQNLNSLFFLIFIRVVKYVLIIKKNLKKLIIIQYTIRIALIYYHLMFTI
jgi:hypothetical protein